MTPFGQTQCSSSKRHSDFAIDALKKEVQYHATRKALSRAELHRVAAKLESRLVLKKEQKAMRQKVKEELDAAGLVAVLLELFTRMCKISVSSIDWESPTSETLQASSESRNGLPASVNTSRLLSGILFYFFWFLGSYNYQED